MSVYEAEDGTTDLDPEGEPEPVVKRPMRDLDDIPRSTTNPDGPGSAFMWTGRMR